MRCESRSAGGNLFGGLEDQDFSLKVEVARFSTNKFKVELVGLLGHQNLVLDDFLRDVITQK